MATPAALADAPAVLIDQFDRLMALPGGVKRLRELILQLAVQGKLVPQDPTDEPASELLKRIEITRKKLTKVSKSCHQFEEYENPFFIPETWLWICFDELFQFIDYRGKTPIKTESGIRLITAKNVRPNYINLVPEEFISHETYKQWMTRGFPQKGDILFTTEAPMGNAALLNLDEKIALAQRIINLHPFAEINSSFFTFCITSQCVQKLIEQKATGMTATGIKASKLKTVLLPLPPLAEQHRIVARVNELMALCEQIEAEQADTATRRTAYRASALNHLTSASSDAERATVWQPLARQFATGLNSVIADKQAVSDLRKTILQLAVQGKLVPQDPTDEPANELLKQIEAEKNRLVKEGKIKPPNPLPPVAEDEFPFALPPGWEWVRLGSVGIVNPRNQADDDTAASFTPMTLISATFGIYPSFEIRYWRDIKAGFTHFAEGDIGIAKITPCFENGKSGVFRGLENGIGAGTTELHIFRPIRNTINSEFVLTQFKSPRYLIEGEKGMTGSAGQKRVPKEYIANKPFPLPPLAEQHRIVTRVNELMTLCDALEAQLAKAQGHGQALLGSLVHHVAEVAL